MAVLRFVHFKIDPADAGELLARRAALISATRRAYPGLTDARLAKVDDETWIDVWRWDSPASLQAATDGAHAVPEVAAAFALTKGATAETAEVVDER
jgi:hypothetical protein